MKTILIPIILLFASCSKMEEIVNNPFESTGTEIHVHAKDAKYTVFINYKPTTVDCLNNHCVNVYKVDSINNLSIINQSMGKLDLTIYDYDKKAYFEINSILNFLKIK